MNYYVVLGCFRVRIWWLVVLLVGFTGCDRKAPEQMASASSTAATERTEPWADGMRIMETAPGQRKAVAYLLLRNPTAVDLVITDVRTAAAGVAQVHRHLYEDGMMKMRAVAHARIPARGELAFEPGAYHIMLMDLVEPLTPGMELKLTFEFANGGSLDLSVPVVKQQ